MSAIKQWSEFFRVFAANWRRFFVIHVVINVLVFVVLAPLATVLLNFAVSLSGNVALSDQDILFFLLSPAGLVSMLITGSIFSIIIFLEHSALLTIAYYETGDHSVTGSWLLAFLGKNAASLFSLSLRILLRVLLMLVPFLLLLFAVYHFLLGEYDINFYLSEKPPEFIKALILGALIGSALVYALLRLFISWVFCLPFLLINALSPGQALASSREAVHGKRLKIGAWLSSWLGFSLLASAVVSGLMGIIGTLILPLAAKSFATLLAVVSFIALLGTVLNFVLTLCASSILSLLILSLFRDLELDHDANLLTGKRDDRRFDRYLNGRNLAWASLAAIILAVVVIDSLLDRVQMSDQTEVMAHRGASGMAPENTIAAIQAAIDAGADWVEIDVQETADGEIVVIHDSDLKKVAGKSMKIADSSIAELQSVDIGSWFGTEFSDQRIPSLKQVLELCKGTIGVNIELKYYGGERLFEESVARIVEATDMQDQVVLMSLNYNGIRKMRELRPGWTLGLLSTVSLGNVIRLDIDFLALNARSTSRTKIRSIHNQDKKVMVWTVNDAVGMSIMFGRGVDAIITDEPALAVSVLEQRKELNPAERLLLHLADVFDQPSMYVDQ
jgi:glycerophosphoryl diester phosphodiesterase